VAWSVFSSESDSLVSPPSLRSPAFVKADPDTLYMFGGMSSSGNFFNDVWRLVRTKEKKWIWTLVNKGDSSDERERNEFIPRPRARANMVLVGRHLVVFGGYWNPKYPRHSEPL
jgi:hypothetical protein